MSNEWDVLVTSVMPLCKCGEKLLAVADRRGLVAGVKGSWDLFWYFDQAKEAGKGHPAHDIYVSVWEQVVSTELVGLRLKFKRVRVGACGR